MTNDLDPTLIHRERGGWLAVSHPDDPLRIGVVGADERSARSAFGSAAHRWRELCEAARRREERG